jgi:hypothetical protein
MAIDYTRSLTKQGIKRENINKYFKDIGNSQKNRQSSGNTSDTMTTGTWYGPVDQQQQQYPGTATNPYDKPPRPTPVLETRPQGMGPFHGSWTNPALENIQVSPVVAQQQQQTPNGLASASPNSQGNFNGIFRRFLQGLWKYRPNRNQPDYSNVGGAIGPVDVTDPQLGAFNQGQLTDAERLGRALSLRRR